MDAYSPLLTEAPALTAFDQQRWVLRCPTGHQLLLNSAGADLLRLVAEAPGYPAGCQAFNARYATALTPVEFEHLITERFGGYRLLAGEQCALRPEAVHHIKLRLQLLPARWAGLLAAPLATLYAPVLFWPLLALLLALLATLCLTPVLTVPLASSVSLVALFYGSMLVHELGHIAACRRAGLAHGGIGVGFYLFMPVLYADVTAIWQATRHQRVIANLGGIHSQLLYAGAVAAVGLAQHAPGWLLTAQAITLCAVWQLNPFVRHDGYWLISDLTNTPNLLVKARQVRQKVLHRSFPAIWRRGEALAHVGPGWGWLLAYGLVNSLIMLGFVGVLLYSAGPAVLHLPTYLSLLGHKLVNGTISRSDITTEIVTAVGFYGIVFQVLLLPYIAKRVGFLRRLYQ